MDHGVTPGVTSRLHLIIILKSLPKKDPGPTYKAYSVRTRATPEGPCTTLRLPLARTTGLLYLNIHPPPT